MTETGMTETGASEAGASETGTSEITTIGTGHLARSILAALKAIEATVREHENDRDDWESRAFDRWASLLDQIPELEGVDFTIDDTAIETAEFKVHLTAAIGFLEAYVSG